MLIYKIVVALLALIILQRCIFPKYCDNLKDFFTVFIVLITIIINNFQIFNLCIMGIVFIFFSILIFEKYDKNRLDNQDYEDTRNKITSLQCALAYYMDYANNLDKKYNQLLFEKEEVFNRLSAAAYYLYSLEKSTTNNPKNIKIIKECIELYTAPIKTDTKFIDIFDNLSDVTEIKHAIKELKFIRKNVEMGEKFNNFIEHHIILLQQCLEETRE